jgi:hypothetical protein
MCYFYGKQPVYLSRYSDWVPGIRFPAEVKFSGLSLWPNQTHTQQVPAALSWK